MMHLKRFRRADVPRLPGFYPKQLLYYSNISGGCKVPFSRNRDFCMVRKTAVPQFRHFSRINRLTNGKNVI